MATNDILALKVHGVYQKQNIVQTLHYKVTQQSCSDWVLLGRLCDAWNTAHTTDWLGNHNSDYLLAGIRADMAFSNNGTLPPGYLGLDAPGTVTDNPLPSYICGCVTCYVNSPNPRHRGRIMFSGRTEPEYTENGQMTLLAVSALEDLVAALWQDTLEGDDCQFQLGIFSKANQALHEIVKSQGAYTPALLRSRRVRQFNIG